MNLYDLAIYQAMNGEGGGGDAIHPILHMKMVWGGVNGEDVPAEGYNCAFVIKNNMVYKSFEEEKTIRKDEFVDIDRLVYYDALNEGFFADAGFFFTNDGVSYYDTLSASNMVNCEFRDYGFFITDPTKDASATITISSSTDPPVDPTVNEEQPNKEVL